MKKKLLIASLLLTLVNCAYAKDSYNVTGGSYPYLFDVYGAKESLGVEVEGEKLISAFDIYANYRKPLFVSAQVWSSIINGKSSKPADYSVMGIKDYNAGAMSPFVNIKESPYKVTNINAVINNLTIKSSAFDIDFPNAGTIQLGLGVDPEHPGWAPYSGKHALYHGDISDLNAVMAHEIMHSLGVTSYVMQFKEDKNDETYYFSKGKNDSLSIFDKDLRLYQGDYTQQFDPNLELVPQNGMSVGKGKDFDIITYSPYYVGEKTLKVLAGKENYDEARQAIIDNGGFTNYSSDYNGSTRPFPQVFGLPIHPKDSDEIDLSHIELRNSYMSHQDYRNWLIPMEAELAVLSDIGYDIDLRKHFGKSYYLNNVTDTYTRGYSEWDGTSYTQNPSKMAQGVGIHIYGDNNNITQASDILTAGEGSFGVRVDGVENTYTLQSGNKIEANGRENIALGVTWGKNHTINVESGAVVQANGQDGIAASFDFGDNLFGAYSTHKGSYIHYSGDWGFDLKPDGQTTDALVENFNVEGTLEGKKAAIYISDNAHVKNINILRGAQINGDIISKWNSVSSGKNAKVQWYDGVHWDNIDPKNHNEMYYTNLNFASDYDGTVKGSIDNLNGINSTLLLNNYGKLTVEGHNINTYSLFNTGELTVNNAQIYTQDGSIGGFGTINVNDKLELAAGVNNIENTISLPENSVLSVMNNEVQPAISVSEIETNNGQLAFDLGDKFNLENASRNNKAGISQIKYDEQTAKTISGTKSVELFEGSGEVLDLGDASANIYYGGKKYTLTQDSNNKHILNMKKTADGVELGDAAKDKTAANYIVTEDALTKNAGTVKGDSFEISGNSINVNGHKGLVVDKKYNKEGTTLKTDIYGASDSDITVKNGGALRVVAQNDNLAIGQKDEVALKLKNGRVSLDSGNNKIVVGGAIKGSDNKKDIVSASGIAVAFNKVSDVSVDSDAIITVLNDKSSNSVWKVGSSLHVMKDSYIGSDASNQLIMNSGAVLNVMNKKASDIRLSKMVLNSDISTAIDVDIKNMKADRFVFKDSKDLVTNSNLLHLSNMNVLNSENALLTDEKYTIPIVSKAFHNEKLLGAVIPSDSITSKEILTPIFKYNFGFKEDEQMAGFVLTRGKSGNYNSYNPAIMVSPIAAQLGGYLSQLNSYDEAFRNLDMKMLMTREERKAFKMANLYASAEKPQVFSETYLPEKDSAGWFRPYSSFEKVGLRNGPRVGNIMYGSYFGADSQMYETANGWDYQYSLYAGYNGSHQHFDGNSIYQNGGNLGATGIWYKGDFFTALTANVGAGVAEASTMYGNEDFPMLMTGVASKTGYNWELARGRFIIQPNYLMSYTFVNTFDYRNAAGVKVNSDPLHAINIAPGVKFIGNLKHGWQPYAVVQMVWNIMDRTDFRAQDVSLPNLSVKPYIQYGVGIQKRWGERFTGFGQAMIRNGGRNGVALALGFRWALGKNDSKKNSVSKNTHSTTRKVISKI